MDVEMNHKTCLPTVKGDPRLEIVFLNCFNLFDSMSFGEIDCFPHDWPRLVFFHMESCTKKFPSVRKLYVDELLTGREKF